MAKTDNGTGGRGAAVSALLATAVAVVIAAFVALVVAGVSIADTLPAGNDVARDTGDWGATLSWAPPLGLLGIAVMFGVVIPASLARIRAAIHVRRDALTTTLPALIQQH